jgi:sigma-B regulation protein RsbU (phosphoserine phosphatase)
MPQTDEYLEVLDPAGRITNVPVEGTRLTIGRGADAQVKIDSFTVSRHHTEVFKDPFGRWWVRDLKSRNGTRVNGAPITEQSLNFGDVIEIEDFRVRLKETTSTHSKSNPGLGDSSGITLVDRADAPVRAFAELDSPKIDATHLSALTALSATLLGIDDAPKRLQTLCQLMVSKSFQGMSAVALRLARKNDQLQPEVIHGPESARNWRKGQLPHVSNTMMKAVRQTLGPVIASSGASTSRTAGEGVLAMSISGSEAPVLAAIACPIYIDNDTIDILYVTFPPEFGTNEWLALANLAAEQFTQAESAWASRQRSEKQALIEKELDRARKIQLRLVPRQTAVTGLDLAFGFEPCRWVGGDYIDAVRSRDGKLLLAIADVCGKGLQAALVTASLHTMIHTNADSHDGPIDLMTRLNAYLHEMLPQGSFVTMILMHLDPATGEFELVNAGHPPALLVKPDFSFSELESGANVPLGLFIAPQTSSKGVLEPGHLLALYTDGLTEMTNDAGKMLGTPELATNIVQACKAEHTSTAAKIGETLTRRLDLFRGSALPQDDRTFLLARRVRA